MAMKLMQCHSPDVEITNRSTKRLPALAKKFLETAKREMGVNVFMLVSYRNSDEDGCLARWGT
jgi:hypothetical protein